MSSSLRNLSRHVALDMLSMLEVFRPISSRPKVHFILLHQVCDQDRNRFEKFLDWLQQHYRIVSYTEAVEQLQNQDTEDSVAAISFDDGFKNNLNAAEIMTKKGISGCFFVCPNIVGEKRTQVVDRYCKQRMLFKSSIPFMDWDDLEMLLETGHEIGNHSNHHFYMHELEDDEFVEEVASARDEIVSRLGSVKHFAWPYGRFFHFLRHRVGTVLQLGHETVASGERGCHEISELQVPYCLRRDSIDIAWPLRHVKTLLKRSSRRILNPDQSWPIS